MNSAQHLKLKTSNTSAYYLVLVFSLIFGLWIALNSNNYIFCYKIQLYLVDLGSGGVPGCCGDPATRSLGDGITFGEKLATDLGDSNWGA